MSIKVEPFSFTSTSVIGKRVVATCTTSSDEKIDFKWLKNGREIKNLQHTSVRSFPEFSTFIIDSLTEDDAGNYTCVASSRGYTDSYTTNLNVLGNNITYYTRKDYYFSILIRLPQANGSFIILCYLQTIIFVVDFYSNFIVNIIIWKEYR